MNKHEWPVIIGLSICDLAKTLAFVALVMLAIGVATSWWREIPFDWRQALLLEQGARSHLALFLVFIGPILFAGIVAFRRIHTEEYSQDK